MRRIVKLDRRVLDLVQDAYLWLLDWTGVRVGSLCFATWSAQIVLKHEPVDWVDGFFICGWGLLMFWRYAEQGWNTRRYNDAARAWRDSPFRLMWLAIIAGAALAAVARLDTLLLIGDGWNLVTCYLLAVQVREREPREFFSRAAEASSGA